VDDALIFVAYEGFQLLTYDYGNIENHKRNLPRVIFISISLVAVLYMVIAFDVEDANSIYIMTNTVVQGFSIE